MIHPIPINETYEYILPEDKENPTIWILGHLDSLTKSKIFMDLFSVQFSLEETKSAEYVPKKHPLEMDFAAVRFGLKGFKNFQLNGKEIEFKTEKLDTFGKTYLVVADEILSMIPQTIISKLARKIFEEISISEEQRKNL